MNSLKYIVTRLLKGAGKSDHENIITRLEELEKIESQTPNAADRREKKRIKEINEVYESIQKRRRAKSGSAESRPNEGRSTKSSFLNKYNKNRPKKRIQWRSQLMPEADAAALRPPLRSRRGLAEGIYTDEYTIPKDPTRGNAIDYSKELEQQELGSSFTKGRRIDAFRWNLLVEAIKKDENIDIPKKYDEVMRHAKLRKETDDIIEELSSRREPEHYQYSLPFNTGKRRHKTKEFLGRAEPNKGGGNLISRIDRLSAMNTQKPKPKKKLLRWAKDAREEAWFPNNEASLLVKNYSILDSRPERGKSSDYAEELEKVKPGSSLSPFLQKYKEDESFKVEIDNYGSKANLESRKKKPNKEWDSYINNFLETEEIRKDFSSDTRPAHYKNTLPPGSRRFKQHNRAKRIPKFLGRARREEW